MNTKKKMKIYFQLPLPGKCFAPHNSNMAPTSRRNIAYLMVFRPAWLIAATESPPDQ